MAKWIPPQKNRDKITARVKKRRRDLTIKIQIMKLRKKCIKCGEKDIRCLDFHHRKPKNKKFGIPQGINKLLSLKKILKEIKKCDIVCSNCHRKEHVMFRIEPTWP